MLVDGASSAVSLGRPRLSARALHHFIFGSLLIVITVVIAGGVATLGRSASAGLSMLALCAICLALFEITRRGHLREITPGQIRVDDGGLWIEHPPTLETPLAIPLEHLAVAAIEDTPSARALRERDDAEETDRFPIYGDQGGALEDRVIGYLWSPGDRRKPGPRFPVRQLGGREQPNLVLLFHVSVTLRDLRRNGPWGPRAEEAVGGLAIRLDDAGAAEALFLTSGVQAEIREEDLDRLFAINAEAQPSRRSQG
jgi:hypothetical protein